MRCLPHIISSSSTGTCRCLHSNVSEALRQRGTGVGVVDLQVADRAVLTKMKEGEEAKVKHYSALCWCARAVTASQQQALAAMQDVQLQQDTPVRVLHRRAPLVRTKVRRAQRRSHGAMVLAAGSCEPQVVQARHDLRGDDWLQRTSHVGASQSLQRGHGPHMPGTPVKLPCLHLHADHQCTTSRQRTTAGDSFSALSAR